MLINEIINEKAMDTKSARYELLSLLQSVVTCIESWGGLVLPLYFYCERNSEANINGDECG